VLLALGTAWLAAAQQPPAKLPPPAKRAPEVEESDAKAAPPAKGQRVEEEEDTAKPPKKVIRVEEAEAPAKAAAPPARRPSAGAGGRDLATLAKTSKNPKLRRIYADLAVPHDVFTTQTGTGAPRDTSVEPVPVYVGNEVKARWGSGQKLQPLDAFGKAVGRQYTPSGDTLKSVHHYEQLVLGRVNEFLAAQEALPDYDTKNKLSREEQLEAAEILLTAALRFHESAKATGHRKGDDWEAAVEAPLRSRLLDIRLEQLKALADAAQWDQAFELTKVLAGDYPRPEDQRRIAKPLADLLAGAFRSGIESPDANRLTLQRLRQLEDLFPGKEILQPVSAGLQRRAEELFKQARAAADAKQEDKARDLVSRALEAAPNNNQMREYLKTLLNRHSILRVGVRNLPELMSPSLAATDSERRAVELMFEGLVKFGVDATGTARFVPGLAESRPSVEPLGRRFLLPRNVYWSDNQPLDANDVRDTVRWLKEGAGAARYPGIGELLDKVIVLTEPYRVRLPLQQGYLEPLSLMTFKVLPRRLPVDSEEFARAPVGSGPYRFDKAGTESGHPYVGFVYNPSYGSRRGKEGHPHVREIRFYQYDPTKAEQELTRHPALIPMDILLDLPVDHAAELAKRAGAAGVAVRRPGRGMSPTRRVYFLAVNNGMAPFDNAFIRKAVAHAINREKLLDEFFRPKVDAGVNSILGRLHAALNGPYPAGTWACNPKAGVPRVSGSLDLYNPETARAYYRQNIGRNAGIAVTLKYPDDDPALKPAMEALCRQLQEIGLKTEPVPMSPRKLRNDVETGNYYLAYQYYDFADETYWLWPLLAPRPGRDGRNVFRCDPGDLTKVETLFRDAMVRREFETVKRDTWLIHDELCDRMFFIPLWQLDPLAAVHGCVEAPPFDPLLVFSEIENWKVNAR
jgi:ABC-type transport system substrate-binding protein